MSNTETQSPQAQSPGKRLLNIHAYGEAYRRGVRYPGWFHAYVETEDKPRYYTEDGNTFASIIADLRAQGIDVSRFDLGLRNWVKTGQGFNVITGHNCTEQL